MPLTELAAPRVAIVTLGCAKNEVGSQEMAVKLARAGYVLADAVDEADAIIINTCSFVMPFVCNSLKICWKSVLFPTCLAPIRMMALP